MDVVQISKRLGHAGPHITFAIFSHLFDRADALSADAINRALARR